MDRQTLSSLAGLAAGGFVLASLALVPGSLRAEGRSETFQTYCAACHGDDGKAQTEEGKKKGARDLTSKKWQDSVKDDRLAGSITKGRGKMPKFGGKLSEDEINALVKEVRSLAGK